MKEVSLGTIAEYMALSIYVDRPHPTLPGVVISEMSGPLHELVALITRVLNQTGEILVSNGYADLGSFVA
jgi:hypothetical protein